MIRQLILPSLAMLFLGGFFLGFSGSVDDAHITYWSAWVLSEYGEILNYNLERVEQSSALLQVLALALLRSITGMSPVTLGHVTTLIVSLLSVWLTASQSLTLRSGMAFVSAWLLATMPFFVYWAHAGMEGPWLACLLLLTVRCWASLLTGQGSWPGVFILAVAVQLCRPEMLLVMPVIALLLFSVFIVQRSVFFNVRPMIGLFVMQCLVALIIYCWRAWYFNDGWPQPVSAKTGSGVLANVLMGMQYAWSSFAQPALIPFSAISLFALCSVFLSLGRLPLQLWLASVIALVYGGFVIASGGDWMAAGRFWVPVLPLLVLVVSYFLAGLESRLLRHGALVVTVLGHVAAMWHGVGVDSNGVPLWKKTRLVAADSAGSYSFFELHGREHLHDIPTLAFARPLVAQLLQSQPPGQPLRIMAGQAGMVIYYLATEFPGKLRVIDRNGLTDRTFTDCQPAKALPRTRNGLGNGYEWVVASREALRQECGFEMPDLVFDIDTGWNRRNTEALSREGYVTLYRQKGHIIQEDGFLPLRRIGAGQYVAVSQSSYFQLGRPAPILRNFDLPLE